MSHIGMYVEGPPFGDPENNKRFGDPKITTNVAVSLA